MVRPRLLDDLDQVVGYISKIKLMTPGMSYVWNPNTNTIEVTSEGGEGAHPDLATHNTLGLATQAELDAHEAAPDPHTGYALSTELSDHAGAADPHAGYQRESEKGVAGGYASLDGAGTIPDSQIPATIARDSELPDLSGHVAAPDPHTQYTLSTELTAHEGAADPHTGYVREADANWVDLTDLGETTLHTHPAGAGAPTDADYLVGTANGGLSNEIVVGTSPGGELGGTWASPTVDATHSGSAHHTRSHAITSGSDHSHSGGTAGRFFRETGASSFAFEAIPFSRGGTAFKSDGITAAVNIIVWRAPFACTVTAVKGYRVGGSGATVNARRNGTDNHLASAVSLSSADTWTDGGSVQNTAYAAGDKMEIMVVSATGSPTQVAVQVDLTRP